ncbi:hypothetical protein Tco_1004212 [Tanacetum coccineum]|uniref:Reverse transcriptase domain-containing protein n=1 Tax=Tanacetum coccineum TaxID=301880 RepID=A0ABQ5FCD3_9ASTR
MSMTIQSSVKDKILATQSETSKYEYEIRYHPSKANVVTDALSKKERVKPRRVRAMAMTIQYGVRGMILAAQSEAFKQENVLTERLHGLDQHMERKKDELYFMDSIQVLLVGSEMDEAHASRNNMKKWNSGDDQLRLRWMIYLVVLADAAESVRDAIRFEYCLASSSGWTNVLVLSEMTDKVVSIKEKFKAVRDRQKSYAGNRRKPLEFEVRDHVLLKVSPWKGMICFGKKGKLAQSSVYDTFHVSNLKKCLADANLHEPLDAIEVDKTLHFVKEAIEIMDRGIKKLKRKKIALVKVRWNSKRGPETRFPQRGDTVTSCDLIGVKNQVYLGLNLMRMHACGLVRFALDVDLGGSPAGIHGLFSEWYCGLASRKVTLGVSMAWAKGLTTGTLVRYEMSRGRWMGNHVEDVDVKKSG